MATIDPQAVVHQIETNKATMEGVVERAVTLAEQSLVAAQEARTQAMHIYEAIDRSAPADDKIKSWNARLDHVAQGLGKLLVLVVAAGAVVLALYYAPAHEGRVASGGFTHSLTQS